MPTSTRARRKPTNASALILDQIAGIDPMSLSAETAREFLAIQLTSALKKRSDELAAKSQAGTLTETEYSEYGDIIHAADIVAILQSKARRALQMQAP